jgi:aspartyl-tRNA synthetase
MQMIEKSVNSRSVKYYWNNTYADWGKVCIRDDLRDTNAIIQILVNKERIFGAHGTMGAAPKLLRANGTETTEISRG